jgi:hypothetical protein
MGLLYYWSNPSLLPMNTARIVINEIPQARGSGVEKMENEMRLTVSTKRSYLWTGFLEDYTACLSILVNFY